MASGGGGQGQSIWERLSFPVTVVSGIATVLFLVFEKPTATLIFCILTFVAAWFWLYPLVGRKVTPHGPFAVSAVSLIPVICALLVGLILANNLSPARIPNSPATSATPLAGSSVNGTTIAQNPATQPNPITQIAVTQVSVTQVAVTQVAVTQVVVTQVAVTQIVATSPPVVVTATPPPEPTSPPNTPADAVLEENEPWKKDGVSLTLLDYQFTANRLITNWIFTNNTGGQLSVSYGNDNFSARDNNGNLLKNRGFWDGGDFICGGVTKVLNAGESIKNTECSYPLRFDFDPTKCAKEIIITVSNVSRIERAKWKIPAPPC